MTIINDNNSLHITVDGHVQGVGFRYFVKEKADFLSLSGWVRNRYDGSVEILAQGDPDKLQQLLEAVHLGPSRSIITSVKSDWQNDRPQYSQFSMLPSD
jgi:acylphosphatase